MAEFVVEIKKREYLCKKHFKSLLAVVLKQDATMEDMVSLSGSLSERDLAFERGEVYYRNTMLVMWRYISLYKLKIISEEFKNIIHEKHNG
jgi:phage pi2 protein 07